MRFIACGDSLFSSRNLRNRLDPQLVELLLSADGVFTNAEFCTPNPETPPAAGRGYMTSVRPSLLDEFASLNIRMLSFVNNHTGDYGWQGVLDTMKAAEDRNLIPCGLGRSLREARLPKFLDTPAGRVSVVATSSTRSEVFAASDAGAGVAARPGSNPLRWYRSYVLPEKEFEQLKRIDEMLGTRDSAREGIRIETWEPFAEGTFRFGSMYEGALQIERGERAHVRTYVHEKDAEEILKSIRDASRRSDLTLFSLHTHEGIAENWYAQSLRNLSKRLPGMRSMPALTRSSAMELIFCGAWKFTRAVRFFITWAACSWNSRPASRLSLRRCTRVTVTASTAVLPICMPTAPRTETATLSVLMPSEDSRRIVWCSSIWKTGNCLSA